MPRIVDERRRSHRRGSFARRRVNWSGSSNFPHEKLDCYRLARDVARWVAAVQIARGDADLRDQAIRAARSVALNIAEGCGRTGKSRRYHYSVAAGSAAETAAALDLADLEGASD